MWGKGVFMGVCAPQQSHWAVRPGCACKLAVPGIPVWGTGQGHARDPCRRRCTRVCLCICPCQKEGPLECQTWARVPQVPVEAATQSCAHMLAVS